MILQNNIKNNIIKQKKSDNLLIQKEEIHYLKHWWVNDRYHTGLYPSI